ncbi:MAG: MBL fold metallo-hydrolase, partial [Archaeoglobaceae archaeon]
MKLKSRGCNVYLVKVNGKTFLIDVGTDGKLVARQLKELDGILITHAHFDHVAGAFEVERIFGCPTFAHPEDIPYILRDKSFKYRGLIGFFAKAFEKFLSFKPPENLKSIFELKEINFVHLPG